MQSAKPRRPSLRLVLLTLAAATLPMALLGGCPGAKAAGPPEQREAYRERWWQHVRPRADMRVRLAPLKRFLVTPRVAKHRVFTWLLPGTLPDCALIAFAREDDYFFGVLQSTVHERWARRMGTQLREAESGCRYTPTTCFETFPFPPFAAGVGPKTSIKESNSRRERIANAAVELHRLREGWLNPIGISVAELRARTLTNLYNKRPRWLELAHLDLDRAVLGAYGWPEEWAEGLQPLRDPKGSITPILGVQSRDIEQRMVDGLLSLNQAALSAKARG